MNECEKIQTSKENEEDKIQKILAKAENENQGLKDTISKLRSQFEESEFKHKAEIQKAESTNLSEINSLKKNLTSTRQKT